MRRTADYPAQTEPADAVDTSGSVPPPAIRSSEPTAAAEPAAASSPAMAFDSEPSGSNPRTGTDREADQFDLAQAEALAKVAALAADREDDLGPSKMMVGTAITLGVLVVAMLVLALALSI